MNIKKLLSECVVEQSTLTRTGKFYIKDNVIILEHMGTNKNVWVDMEFANKFTDFKTLETEIREFFNGKVSSIIPMPINEQANEFKGKVEQFFKDNNMEFTDEKFKEILATYRKHFKK
jgi:hypothetical protein